MDAASVDQAVLWGYSRGGRVAAVLAAEHPDRVAALVLHDALPENVTAGTSPPAFAEALMRGDFGPMWESFAFAEDDRRYDEEVNDPRALGALWLGQAHSGIAIDLGRIVAPALVIAGDNDSDAATTVADGLNVKVQMLPGLDHIQAFSRLDLVVPLVLGFLEPSGFRYRRTWRFGSTGKPRRPGSMRATSHTTFANAD